MLKKYLKFCSEITLKTDENRERKIILSHWLFHKILRILKNKKQECKYVLAAFACHRGQSKVPIAIAVWLKRWSKYRERTEWRRESEWVSEQVSEN